MNYAFRLSEHKKKHLVWDQCMYYDVETAAWHETFDDEQRQLLNIRKEGITAFTVRVPKNLLNEAKLERIIARKIQKRDVSIDGAEFVDLYYYDETKPATLRKLYFVLDTVARGLRKTTYLCGFNSEHFDDLIIADRLSEGINRWQYHLPNGKPTKLYTTDLLPWAKAYALHKLADLGDYLGVPKLTGWTNKDEYMDYNMRDVDILTYFVKLLNSHGLYALRPATEARHMMSRELLHVFPGIQRIFSDKQVSDSIPLIGGRTEPYYSTGSDVYCLDVNSLYPCVMAAFHYPEIIPYARYGQIEHIRGCTPARQLRIDEFLQSASEWLLKTAERYALITPDMTREYFERNTPWFGVLYVKLHGIADDWKEYEQQIMHYFPFAHKCNGYTLFSYDPNTIYSIQFYELMWLAFFDYEILDGIEYPDHDKFVIADFIEELYKKRKQAKAEADSMERAYKLLLNAGFGIWATRQHTTRSVTEQTEYIIIYKLWEEAGKPHEFQIIDGNDTITVLAYDAHPQPRFRLRIADPSQRYADNTIPIYAIATTSHARFTLYSYMLNGILTPHEIQDTHRIYYVDTDSIFCSQHLAEFLQPCIGPELGQLKIEGHYKECYWLAPKSYVAVPYTGEPIKKLKGTGPEFIRRIVAQSKTTDYREYVRVALDPTTPQKRKLLPSGQFHATPSPEHGTPELVALYNLVQQRFSSDPTLDLELDL